MLNNSTSPRRRRKCGWSLLATCYSRSLHPPFAFSLIEVLVAVALVGTVMTALLLARLDAVRQADWAAELTRATRLAEQIIRRMDLPGFDPHRPAPQLDERLIAGLRWQIVPANRPADWPTELDLPIYSIRVWSNRAAGDSLLVDLTYVPRKSAESER